uniref:Uncharacterized protein n=1 Tax=Lactuca sativa TaxID=4236 RepID=A0A9R1VS51_LACSA|nr:hypothetical protein LSAT_V11C400217710 [Lactuca sativa]
MELLTLICGISMKAVMLLLILLLNSLKGKLDSKANAKLRMRMRNYLINTGEETNSMKLFTHHLLELFEIDATIAVNINRRNHLPAILQRTLLA